MNSLLLKLYLAAKSALAREAGQSMTEYAMAVAMIAFGCVAGEATIASSVNHTFVALANVITAGVLR